MNDNGTLPTIEITVTYLEMTERPRRPSRPVPLGKLAILRAERPPVAFYRFLYDTVGEPWQWTDRRLMADEELAAVIHDPRVEIYVLYSAGVPAGYVELDARSAPDVDLAYFGLMPEFVGRGLGPYFLDWAVDAAWLKSPRRVTVNTCDLDHPQALATYQRAGFVAYERKPRRLVPLAALGPAPRRPALWQAAPTPRPENAP